MPIEKWIGASISGSGTFNASGDFSLTAPADHLGAAIGVAFVEYDATTVLDDLEFAGTSSTLLKAQNRGTSRRVEVWYLTNPIGSGKGRTITARGPVGLSGTNVIMGVTFWVGVDTTLIVMRKIIADTGAYSLVGQTATLLANRILAADAGSYALTGVDVDMIVSILMAAATGDYSVVGQTILGNIVSPLDIGAYNVTGSVSLFGITIPIDTGSYALTGQSALFKLALATDTGAYSVTGREANLLADYIFLSNTGTYALTGVNAALRYGAVTLAGTGSYLVTGTDIEEIVHSILAAVPGSYAVTGKDATLIFDALHPDPLPTLVAWRFIVRGRGD